MVSACNLRFLLLFDSRHIGAYGCAREQTSLEECTNADGKVVGHGISPGRNELGSKRLERIIERVAVEHCGHQPTERQQSVSHLLLRSQTGRDGRARSGTQKAHGLPRRAKGHLYLNTWLIETGDNTGNYVTSTCGHAWKDFDEWEARMGKADTADANINITPNAAGGGRNGFYVYRADMSLAPANQPPAPMTAVTIYVLHPGSAPDFIAAIKRINDSLAKQPD